MSLPSGPLRMMNSPASPVAVAPQDPPLRMTDLVALTKPRITVNVMITMLGGFFLASPRPEPSLVASTVVGTWLVVGGANALNMYLERHSDGYMRRTATRPLPAGRMAPSVALYFGLGLTLVALLVLAIGVGPLAAMLAAVANLSYVLMYTPLKARSSVAVWVGAVPGAIPPLLGWAAATGELSLTGMSLFLLMFFWQIPHFHAIALFRQDEYARAGLRVLPLEQGDVVTRRHIAFWSVVLLLVSATPFLFGQVSRAYLGAAALLGVPFTLLCLGGLRPAVGPRWAHQVFGFSILYLLALFAALLCTRV